MYLSFVKNASAQKYFQHKSRLNILFLLFHFFEFLCIVFLEAHIKTNYHNDENNREC